MTASNNRTATVGPLRETARFSKLLKSAIHGVCFNLKEHVLATHREIAILRRCSEFLLNEPNRVVHIVASAHHKQCEFIEKTLMHLKVSCGQINLNTSKSIANSEKDIWLFVAEKKA